MEGGGRKAAGASSSSSSLSTELFGPKESLSSMLFSPPNAGSSSSTGVFNSDFSTPSGGLGRDSSQSDVFGSWKKENPEGQAWNGKHASAVGIPRSSESKEQSISSKDGRPVYRDEKIPCFLSSSLYYGGRDICTHSPSTQASETSTIFKKDGEEREGSPPGVSRGNWWQGSLYY